jgi:branched-chain amino acid transport system ATP-binding protein
LERNEAILSLKDVSVSYGNVRALRGVTLIVHRGEIVVLVGANGAGKTTIMGAALGAVPIGEGGVYFDGEAITGRSVERNVRSGLSLVPEGRGVFASMSVIDNLLLGARFDAAGASKKLKKVFEAFPVLKERKNQIAGTLSGGERQMLAIGRSLMSSPKMILVDEPSIGLAPLIVNSIFEILAELNREGYSILLSEQNVNKALQIADRAYVIETGRIVASGTASEMLDDPKIREAYLGA